MEEGRNFLKEIEEENKAKEHPKPYKDSSFKGTHSAIARIQQENKKDYSESSDGGEEEKDMEVDDKVADLPMPQSSFTTAVPKFSGKIKYTSGEDIKVKNRLTKSHSPMKWSDAFAEREMIDDKVPIYFSGTTGPVLFCIHGAGHSALSFGPLAVAVKDFARVASYDLRGHGGHHVEGEQDMPIEILLEEAMTALQYVINKYDDASIIICGHSLGGAIAAKLAYKIVHPEDEKEIDFDPKHIVGVFVIDVAEGSALGALPFMEQIVESRPESFDTVEDAIKFGITSGQVKKIKSARLTMPDLIVEKDGKYVWRTDLLASKDYWSDWFTGMNKCFLEVQLPKTLVIASNDRMDKELTIAQMQGKFKLASLFDVGHTVQEDAPEDLGAKIKEFIDVFRIKTKYNEKLVITNAAGKQIVIDH